MFPALALTVAPAASLPRKKSGEWLRGVRILTHSTDLLHTIRESTVLACPHTKDDQRETHGNVGPIGLGR